MRTGSARRLTLGFRPAPLPGNASDSGQERGHACPQGSGQGGLRHQRQAFSGGRASRALMVSLRRYRPKSSANP